MNDLDTLMKKNICLSQAVPNKEDLFCSPIFDDLELCWNYTKAGNVTYQYCPDVPGFNTKAMASKICETDGSWYIDKSVNRTWTNFEPCLTHVTNINTVYIFFAGYSISAVFLSASLFIFFYFKRLQCERVLLHKHLFVSYLINAIVWVIFFAIISNPNVMVDNPAYCQFMFIIVTFFSVSTYFWTFSEGFYLAMMLVFALQQGSQFLVYLCMFSGWGLPLILTICYVSVRYYFEKPTKCWTMKTKMQYILTVPNTLALIANSVIVIVILKILVTKLWHPSNREQRQWRKTARAILILFPVLGIQNVLFFISSEEHKVAIVQEFITATMGSFQGVVVSFILCFCNNEVRRAVIESGTNHHRFRVTRNVSVRSIRKSDASCNSLDHPFQNKRERAVS